MINGNEVYLSDTKLVYATNDVNQLLQCTYQPYQGAQVESTDPIHNSITGVNSLEITISQQGYYTCTLNGGTSYIIAIFNRDVTIGKESCKSYDIDYLLDSKR